MIAMNPSNSETSGPTIQKVGSGIVLLCSSNSGICDYMHITSQMRADIVEYNATVDEYRNNIDAIIENIEEVTLAFKDFGAAIHRVYSRYFNRYMWTVKFWPLKYHFKCTARALHNIPVTRYFSGTYPQNRGRHFNRRAYWKRK